MPGPGGEAWTEDDVEYALAWQRLQADKCSGCGQPRSESFDVANHASYEGHALQCHACAARDVKSKLYQDGGGDMAGLYISVSKRPGGG